MDNLNRAPDIQSPPYRTLPETDIIVKHPGYQDEENEMMLFRGFDRVGPRDGLHHGTVLTACHIVSGHSDGFLAQERGGTPIQLQFDEILVGGIYYFTVPNDNDYAIFPRFDSWPFPHNDLPASWTRLRQPRSSPLVPMPAQSNAAQAILDRDSTCLLSGLGDIRERAHICPKEELLWFQANNMRRYNLNRLLTAEARIDDMSNATAMRSDIHKAYDKRLFVLVPKINCWTVHFMEPTFHLGSLYHNMRVNIHRDLGLEHMFSRFAWTVFPLVREFLEQGPPRWIRTRVADGNDVQAKNTRLDRDAISKAFFPRGRSASPKKRKMRKDDDDDDNSTAAAESLEMDHRGRKRRRLASASKDNQTNENDTTSGLAVKDQNRAYGNHTQNPSIPTSLFPRPRTSLSESRPQPSSPVTTIDDCGKSSRVRNESTGITDEDPRIQEFYDYEDKYDRLRRKELDRRRPQHNPDLYCCDYEKHRKSVWAAIKGEGPWDAYELCDECLGGEYEPLAADLET
ncbi:MAG: hypothetical protein Q9219_007361 [cf. Caloplaca sp. 3 TL-2023]